MTKIRFDNGVTVTIRDGVIHRQFSRVQHKFSNNSDSSMPDRQFDY